jgi:uncharacterized protein YqgC (DUF456 family)
VRFRPLLVGLIYAFFTLLAAFAVVMGGYLLAAAVEDSPLAMVLRIIGIVCLFLLAINAVLLLLATAMAALTWDERARRDLRPTPARERRPGDPPAE